MSIEDFMWTCPIKHFFGIECLGCGAQSALLKLLSGDFKEAFVIYPAIYTLCILFLAVLMGYFLKIKTFKKFVVPLILINVIIIIFQYFYKFPLN